MVNLTENFKWFNIYFVLCFRCMLTALSRQRETPMKAAWRRRKDKDRKRKTRAEKKQTSMPAAGAPSPLKKETTILFLEFDRPLRRRQVML
jgi:hypothetical protein